MTDYPASTVNELLAQTAAGAPAIGAPGRPWMTHAGLRAQMQQTVDALNAIGIGRNDRVAIVLPNGPEMACAFIAIAAGATTAPLNPAYRTEEFVFYLADLSAKALVIGEGMESPARAVAEATNIPIVELIAGEAQPALSPCARRIACAARRRERVSRRPTTWRWCCTPRAPPPAPRSCRCGMSTSPPPPRISATRCV